MDTPVHPKFKKNQNKTENAKSVGPHLKDSAEGEALTGGSWRESRPSSSPTVCAQPDPEHKSDDMARTERKPQESVKHQRKTWLQRDLDGDAWADARRWRVLARASSPRPSRAVSLFLRRLNIPATAMRECGEGGESRRRRGEESTSAVASNQPATPSPVSLFFVYQVFLVSGSVPETIS
jgi:hypothetical protein